MSNKVISIKNLPPRYPFTFTIASLTAMEVFGAPEWLYGVFGLLVTLVLIAVIHAKFTDEQMDIFKDK